MLDVVIAGAGIAGLTAGVALRRAGHRVRIYEKSSMNEEVGAAINLPPNAGRYLISWGLDPVRWRFVKAEKIVWINPRTFEVLASHVHESALEKYGADVWHTHRVDLHDALKSMAIDSHGLGIPVTIYSSSLVVGYNSEKPTLILADGNTIHGDVVIAADGLHSIACETVIGQRNPPVQPKHYNYCYRFLIPSKVLEADREARWLNEESRGLTRLFTDNETSRRIVTYTCRDNEFHNFVGIFYDEQAQNASQEDYLVSVDKAEILQRFKGFHPKILAVINNATDIKRWPLFYRAPIAPWRKGKMALLGDAAHPMLPHLAQGAAQGIEDAIALGVVLRGTTQQDIEQQLDLYERIRRNRASIIQILSNVGLDQSHLVKEELEGYMDEGDIPTSAPETYDYAFRHRVEDAALALLPKSIPGRKA